MLFQLRSSTPRRYENRAVAGRELGRLLRRYRGQPDVLVLGLPRGGVPVAAEVARALAAPLDVFVVRKLGVPGHEELAFGAIASGGVTVMNDDILQLEALSQAAIDAVVRREQRELARRERAFRPDRLPLDVSGKTVIVVDDGLATGATARAAVRALALMQARAVVLAVPVAARSSCDELRADPSLSALVCARLPEPFQAVGLWYDDFAQTSDDEVRAALAASRT